MPSRDYLYPALLFEGGLGLSAALVGWLCGHPPWESLHWTPDAALTGAAATVPMLLGLLWIVQSRLRPVARLTEAVTALAAQLFAGASWLELLLVAAVAGFGEELLFRGLIQAWVEATRGPAVGLLVASLLFGLAHPISLTYAVLAAGIGFYLGWLWLYSGNLLVPIVTHALYDFVALIYLLHKHPRSAPPATDKMPL